eukprot:8778775-Alexandrium_andersonii.AAC.1
MTAFEPEVANLLLNATLALYVEDDGDPSRLCAFCLSKQLRDGWHIQLVHSVSRRRDPKLADDSCVP